MKFWIEPTSFADRLQDAWFASLLWGMLLAGPAVLASSLLWEPRLKQRWLQAIALLWLAGTATLIAMVGPYQISSGPKGTNWIAMAWMAGTGGSLGLLGWRLLRARRFGAGCHSPGLELELLFQEEARALRVQGVRLLIHPDLGDDLAICRHRTVFVSPYLQETLSESQVRAVLRHEIAHAANRHWGQWVLESFLLAPMFWHPFGWWLGAALHEAREMEADDAARQVDRLGYAEALLRLQKAARQPLIFAFARPRKARWKRLAEPFESPGLPRALAARSVTGASVVLAGMIGQLLLPEQPYQLRPIEHRTDTGFQRIQVQALAHSEASSIGASASASARAFVIVGDQP